MIARLITKIARLIKKIKEAIMSYQQTNWQNGAVPAINADNLNNIEEAIAGLVDAFYPVGSVIITTVNTNPGTRPFMDNTTWVAWGSGKVPVGVDTSQTEFNATEKTGGEKTHQLSVNEMPKHSHRIKQYYNWNPYNWATSPGYGFYTLADNDATDSYTEQTGGNGAHNNLQPYITCYMWKRTA